MKRYFPYILALVLSLWGGPAFAQQISGAGTGVQASGPIYAQTSVAAGDTISSGCTGTGCDFASGSYTFSAGAFCPSVGTVYTVYAAGVATTTGTGGNIGEALYIAGQKVGTAQSFVNATTANVPWNITVKVICDTTGTTGTAEISYLGTIETATSSNNGANVNTNPPNTATFTIDTTGTVAVESRGYFATATGSATERQMIITKP